MLAGGVPLYTQDGSLGMPDEALNAFVQATEYSGEAPQRERERERAADQTQRSTDGSRCQMDNERWRSGSTFTNEQTRATETMVAVNDSRGELPVLDKQLLSGDASDTHTHKRRMLKPYIEKNGQELFDRWIRKQC